MTVFLLILKIIGWVLLSILALIVLALFVKVGFRVEYSNENTSVLLRWLFLKLKLYPTKPKEKKPKPEAPPKKEEEAKPEEPKEEQPKQKSNLLKTIYDAEGVDGLIGILQQTAGYTKTFFAHLLHGFVVDEFYLEIRCTKADAAATAIYYGEVCGLVFPLLGALASKCRLKKYDVNIYPDYLARFSDASFVTVFHFTPMVLLGITVSYGCKMLFGVLVKLLVRIFGAKKKNESGRNDNKKSEEKSEIK